MLNQDSHFHPPAHSSPAKISANSGNDPASAAPSLWIKWTIVFVFLPFGYLWFRLINDLRVEWATNPQYSYGFVVPFLCLTFLLQRWQAFSVVARQQTRASDLPASTRVPSACVPWSVALVFATVAFFYLPTRLIEEANPEWRPIQWALGIEAVGLTLCAIYVDRGRGWLRGAAFPLCFFFIAIPWPTLIETPVIQSLTRMNSAIVVEFLGWIGIPAIQHGNLIKVGTGTVGVNEACSSIRSFQTSLMISLFFGEYYDMGIWRRLLFVPVGFILAMAFNVCRVTFLTVVAAKKGVAAIGRYHDPAGVTIALVCTAGLWGLALLMRRKKNGGGDQEEKADIRVSPAPFALAVSPQPGLFRLSLFLVFWFVLAEAGAELWYRHLESHMAPGPKWSAQFPADNPTFENVPISAETENLLRFDEGRQGAWIDSNGFRWEGFYFSWWPGRVAGYLAKRHTPEVCLPALGCKMVSGPELTIVNVNGVALPVRSYVFQTEGGTMYVFHCRWEAGVNEDAYVAHESARFNLVRGIWAGRGKYGQKILEIVISGCGDSEQANAALARQLRSMIKVEKPEEKS